MQLRSPRSGPLHAARWLLGRIVSQFQAAAFWTAVWLPFGYVVLLVGGTSPAVIAAVLAVHAVCLLLGHSHQRSAGDPATHGEGGI